MSNSFIKKVFKTLPIFILFFSISAPARASENFYTALKSTYSISSTGQTTVSKEFHIKNKKSTVYLKKYGIELTSNRITDIQVSDANGDIPANIAHTDTKTTIGLEFPEKDFVVGRDKERVFTVHYTDPDTALFEGNILEIHVPKILHPEEFDEYSVTLQVPKQTGNPTLSEPAHFTVEQTDTNTLLHYRGTEIKSGISVLFGEEQRYSLQLTYHIDNPSQSQGTVQIALPPDTQYQKLTYSSIEPLPQTISVDPDGNWIATYQIDSNSQQTISASGIATIYLNPHKEIPIQLPNKKLSSPDEFWESDAPQIAALAKQLKTPKEIFDFVSEHLQYNYARIDEIQPRFGALKTLEKPSDAVCQEFSDLFISLARANQIPARQIVGYALTNNPQIRPLSLVRDVLHAWPEYFDKDASTWKPVDPTWTNTTGGIDYFNQLDFNHIAFVIQGQSSQKPYPAGSYTSSQPNIKDVQVELTDEVPTQKFQADIKISPPVNSLLGLNSQHSVTITNTSGQAWYNIPAHFTANEGISLSENVYVIEHFLPFQTVTIPLSITDLNASSAHEDTILISIEDQTTRHAVHAGSKWSRWYSAINNPFTIIIVLTTLSAIIIITFIIIFQGKKKKGKS